MVMVVVVAVVVVVVDVCLLFFFLGFAAGLQPSARLFSSLGSSVLRPVDGYPRY